MQGMDGRRRGSLLGACAAVAFLAACSGGSAYYAEMREISAFANADDDYLDEVAESGCGLMESAQGAGESETEALASLQRTLAENMDESEALAAAMSISRYHCPVGDS